MDEKLYIMIGKFISGSKKPLIVLLGQTASGKTSLSIEIAKAMKNQEVRIKKEEIEIINADSRQFYRYLDIGTAKITEEEMNGIPHHLSSAIDPKEEISIAWYQKEAMTIIDDIHARKHVPMLVGGSMLYISAIIDGLIPHASDPMIRKRLESEYDRDQGSSLYMRLSELDPEAAMNIPKQNKRYVVRAMELIEMTGKAKAESVQSTQSPYDLLILGIHRDKTSIDQNIEQRFDQMIGQGWIEEVRSLLQKGYANTDPGMMSHGYREIAQWIIEGERSETWPMVRESIIRQTKHYAKRQRTWWRNDPRIYWIGKESQE